MVLPNAGTLWSLRVRKSPAGGGAMFLMRRERKAMCYGYGAFTAW
uniref:Uncharacterized protein n=1 Tax=Anguilla anguilla TaxID=7936 RepID=A0A0E9UGW2_ANGAN